MVPDEHSLRQLFHDVVADCYAEHLGIRDTEVTSYIADLLTDFCETDRLYCIRDAQGRPVKEVSAMLAAADPVHGTALSFDVERQVRKHIGDYTLFLTGMYPDANHSRVQGESLDRLVQTGKESYYIVSQFNIFEYAREAPFFARMAEGFEGCIYGLTKVRGELDRRFALAPPKKQPRLM